MAARENQGLQIALIIFVMLTMILAVTTYLFFHNLQEEQITSKKVAGEKDAAIAQATKEVGNEEKLKKMLGYAADVDVTKIEEDYTADMAKLAGPAAKIKEDDKNYRFLLPLYQSALDKKSGELADEKDTDIKLNTQLSQVTTANQGEVATYHADSEKVKADLGSELAKYTAGRTAVTAAREQLASAKDKAEKALNDAIDAGRKKADELAGTIAKMTDEMRKRAERDKNRERTDFEIAQGKVVWINQSTRTVNINLGQADGLRKQISFSVYDGTTTNVNKALKKGSLEVIQLDGPHSAVTRIVEDDYKNPLMPGDVIYTPVWQPGHAEHFAMAGFFDIDGDGRSDRQRLHDMVIANGGVVDSEMDEKGEVIGSMDINTKYIIIGERPTDKSEKKMLDNYTKMIAKATDLGVTQIPLHKFLSYVGYTPEKAGGPRTSGGAGSFSTSDKKDDFRPRTPPAKGAAGGAFDK